MNKKVMLYLFEDEYEWLRRKSFDDRLSMNKIIQFMIRDQMSGLPERPKLEVKSKVYKTNNQIKKVVESQFSNLCPHGSMKGLCKKGCK